MKRVIFLTIIVILILTANAFGQNQRKKKHFYNLPEVDDEVLRKKQLKPKISKHRKLTKRKVKPFFDEADALFGKRRKRGVTHDPEFENWANRKKVKSKK